MSYNFNQIRPLNAELPALEHLKNVCLMLSTHAVIIFDWIFFILAGNKDSHDISDEFEIQLDRTKDCGVNCP